MSPPRSIAILKHPLVRYSAPLVLIAILTITFVVLREQVNPATVSLVLVLVVLIAAIGLGRGPALTTALAGGLSLNFFFLPPYYTLSVDDPQNWVELFIFIAVAVTVGQLSARSRQRAEDAERLYGELQVAFDQASQTEAVRRSEKLKSALLDAVTHDIRTPLTSIKAATTMLIQEQGAIHNTLDPAGRADLLAVISEETDRLNNFVDSMVGIARLEAGGNRKHYETVSVAELIGNVLERASTVMSRHEIEVDISPEHLSFNADAKAMAEALYNLVDNACKYSPAGTTIRLSAAPTSRGTRISVEDEGPGIPADERERVFDKFYRHEQAASGLGLGLAIVRGIVEGHGGKAWVEAGRKGARFVLDIPMKPGE